eukprot:CAMPEP_0198284562 /NCGR_PEP_ID=MMETSP1449-20131203/4020_1 /TAXON_ID=420275 /ORGANISM="Attheya septentrionalis, Strain CCMP2084" /LENGTH=417 /DNA_ID=CAMNT_0043981677 /DNA_START=129 /DNA_END=1382 /DNA_ORIENTATION=+
MRMNLRRREVYRGPLPFLMTQIDISSRNRDVHVASSQVWLRKIRLSLWTIVAVGVFWVATSSYRTDSTIARTTPDIPETRCHPYGCPHYPIHIEQLHESGADGSSIGGDDQAFGMVTFDSNRVPHVNQDRAIFLQPMIVEGEQHIDFFLGTFDGHGIFGEVVAWDAAHRVPHQLSSLLSSHTNISPSVMTEALQQAFINADRDAPPNAMTGGCTGSVVVRHGTKLYFANAGDSLSLLASCRHADGANNENDVVAEIVYQTRKDKANLPDEFKRIQSLGGQVHIPPLHPNQSRVVAFVSKQREFVALAMSRSIGDWEFGAVGVTAEPLVDMVDLKEIQAASSFVVISASDGLWDSRTPAFAAQHYCNHILQQEQEQQHGESSSVKMIEATRKLIDLATPPNKNLYRDDITVSAIKIIL